MSKEEFEASLEQKAAKIEEIRQSAHDLHQSVNQTYGEGLPYGYHLDMVAAGAREFGHLVCRDENDVLPMLFGAYYHDSIEDARLTYNDVMHRARMMMTEEQAHQTMRSFGQHYLQLFGRRYRQYAHEAGIQGRDAPLPGCYQPPQLRPSLQRPPRRRLSIGRMSYRRPRA